MARRNSSKRAETPQVPEGNPRFAGALKRGIAGGVGWGVGLLLPTSSRLPKLRPMILSELFVQNTTR